MLLGSRGQKIEFFLSGVIAVTCMTAFVCLF